MNQKGRLKVSWPAKIDQRLLSTLNELSLVGSRPELGIVGNWLVAAMLIPFFAVGAAINVAVALDLPALVKEGRWSGSDVLCL